MRHRHCVGMAVVLGAVPFMIPQIEAATDPPCREDAVLSLPDTGGLSADADVADTAVSGAPGEGGRSSL